MVNTTTTTTTTTNDSWPRAPFPEDCPTHPLLIVDFLKVEAGDLNEIDTLFTACTSLGFFCKFISSIF